MVRPGITLRVEAPARSSLVFIDHVGLSQVLMNLVANAVDAIEGTGHITVSTRRRCPGARVTKSTQRRRSSSVMTASASRRKQSSTPSSPTSPTKSSAHGGYGLPTAWRIIDRSGGSIQIDSSPDSGMTVILRFETVGTDPTEPVSGAEAPTATDFATDVLSESNR